MSCMKILVNTLGYVNWSDVEVFLVRTVVLAGVVLVVVTMVLVTDMWWWWCSQLWGGDELMVAVVAMHW